MIRLFKKHARIWLGVYLIYLTLLTLSPFQFSIDHLREPFRRDFMHLIYEFIYFNLDDIAANLLLFIPFGFVCYFLAQQNSKKWSWKSVFFMGGLISFGIEFTQLFLDRSTNGVDIFMNASGSAMGFVLAGLYERHHEKYPNLHQRFGRKIHGLITVLYGVFVIWLYLFPIRLTTPEWWNPNFPLLFGNEGSLDRPWQGELDWVALYDYNISRHQAQLLYADELDSSSIRARQSLGLIAAYPLTEGIGDTLHDISGFQNPLPMTGDNIQWLQERGIQCKGGLVQSIGPGSKITEAIKKSRAFSVEVWCKPGNLTQGGPARIVSLSPNASQRNFSLAQQGRQIRLRFRSQMGGWNGSDINLRAKDVLDSLGTYHLIATYNHGVEQLFVNGQRHPDVIYGHISYLPEMLGLGIGMFARISMIIGLFFPLSVLACSLLKKNRLFISLVLISLVIFGIDLFYMLSYQAPFCMPLYITGLFSVMLGYLFMKAVMPEKTGGNK